MTGATNMTLNENGSTIILNNATLTETQLVTFAGGGFAYNAVSVSHGNANLAILGTNTFGSLSIPAGLNVTLQAALRRPSMVAPRY
jgi:hypothetical protein